MHSAESKPTFRSNISLSSSCLASSLTLKMMVIFSSKTSVNFQSTTRQYIPEDGSLQLIDIHEICYERHVTGDCPILVLRNSCTYKYNMEVVATSET
jgi:hypothetical protein